MSNQLFPPPFIAEAPIYDDFFDEDGKTISEPWVNWLNSVTRDMGRIITHDVIVDPVTGDRTDIPVVQFTAISQANRDNLENARDGIVIYNTTTQKNNFREGGAWWFYTRNPA